MDDMAFVITMGVLHIVHWRNAITYFVHMKAASESLRQSHRLANKLKIRCFDLSLYALRIK